MGETDPQTLYTLLEDDNFLSLLRLTQERALTWDEVLGLPLPQDVSLKATWEIIERLGQGTGVALNIPSKSGEQSWYRLTYEMSALLQEAAVFLSKGSAVHDYVMSADELSLRAMRTSEVVGAAVLADIPLDESSIDDLLTSQRQPHTDIERLALNMLSLDEKLMTYRQRPFSLGLLSEFSNHLAAGVCLESFDVVPNERKHASLKCERCKYCLINVSSTRNSLIESSLKQLMDYANDSKSPYDSLVLQGNLLSDSIRSLRPFGCLSSFVASLVTRLFYCKHDMPVMAVLPLSKSKALWAERKLAFAEMCCTPTTYQDTQSINEHDYTLHQTLICQLIVMTLREVDAQADALVNNEKRVVSLIRQNSALNSRQQSILAYAARTPQVEFRICLHQQKNNISYATARRDFVELEQLGYLRAEYYGKALVFLPGKNTQELLKQNDASAPGDSTVKKTPSENIPQIKRESYTSSFACSR